MPGWEQFVDLIAGGLQGLAAVTGSAGLAVILFTLLLKIALLPITVRTRRSTAALRAIQPALRELQEKYPDDRQRRSAETLKLYQQHGINPAAGCLPTVIKIPFFIGLIAAIRELSRSGDGAWTESFLWLPDLATADPLHILPIAAGLFQLLTGMMARPAGQRGAARGKGQARAGLALLSPAIVVAIGWHAPAGPVLYWAVSALFSIGEQWLMTGWGAVRDWLPFLPEIPEYRRPGYVDPATLAAEAATRQPPWIFRQINQRAAQRIQQLEAERVRQDG
ncbi:YidC/Oxa1 family membrane protein insertase [Sphaerobacter thermophilus]|uniref:60 kDa inner membrane insertion protein n=1 Tax=Sphaerobacter thermophilus (strain ATCC 49802 / DSM 20745 / KCCM 41009 / NCIMB 13125 / S 6022) TaxID=479434 RepID=D1C7D9_SPHTD|nr:YidC/Oxa1 family membrane protein insertase [Sphaerobacter thermophilus]ACZ39785.1 60 kDa inner membrane insertion protein [Sphaerobacter thermophilus DSM 20745]